MPREDIILIFIFGNVALLGLIGGPIMFYMAKKGAIEQKHETLLGVVVKGILIHIFSSGLFMVFMSIISSLYKLTLTTFKPNEAAYLFFAIDWQHISVASSFDTEGKKALAMLLKTELLAFNLGLIFFILGAMLYFIAQIYKNYKEQSSPSSGGGVETVMELASKKFISIFIILIHLSIMQATLASIKSSGTITNPLGESNSMSLTLAQRIPQSIGGD